MVKVRQYYECHITLEDNDRHTTELAVKHFGWKFSAIDGDPVTGPGVKHYATRHYKSSLPIEGVLDKLHYVADELEGLALKVTRRKVELVLYDDRSSKVRPCDGGCPECHLDDRCNP